MKRLLLCVLVLGGVWAGPAHAASWCGTATTADRTPQLVGGDTVHAVYAIPSDGTDRLAQLDDAIETDGEAIDAWWRGQDPTRTPRFDTFPFGCGSQLDIASVRLVRNGAALTDASAAFQTIALEMQTAGLLSATSKPLIYYDGPVADANICGIGGGTLTDSGMAIVFVNSCSSVSSAWTAAHELGHALGAVPTGAPHFCSNGHVCGSEVDLMNPFATPGMQLTSAILDVGHDDYYAHSGPQPDIQDSPWLKRLDNQVRLALTIRGAGRVESDGPGVDCTATCVTDWDGGTQVSMTTRPGRGLRFVRWSGACRGGGDCSLTLDSSEAVTAFFAPATFPLRVSVAGAGKVVSRPAGLACKPRCARRFRSFTPVRLTATPAKGWRFRAWSGACRGNRVTCAVPMSRAASVRAVFARTG